MTRNDNYEPGKGAKDWKVREKDTMARRRARWDKDQKAEAVEFYGKEKAMGMSGKRNGKGDRRRPTNQEQYEAGYMATFAETPQERAMWAKRWQQLRDGKVRDNADQVQPDTGSAGGSDEGAHPDRDGV